MPDSVKEMLRSDGTAFTVVGDSNILAGVLTNVDGSPRYPIVISLASEAVSDGEIARLTNYVASGGFLFVGSSAFTRNPDGSTRTDFALAGAMGLDMVNPGLTNWGLDSTVTKLTNHTLVAHVPSGTVFWQMPSSFDETTVPPPDALTGLTPNETPPNNLPHMIWQVQTNGATVLVQGDSSPYILVQRFGKGYFIYDAAMQPFLGHGGWAPTTYSYGIFRNAIQWAFQSDNRPVIKISPWPYPYQAAVLFRHDMEAIPSLINSIESSAQFENQNGGKGDYYFCTGCLREDYSPAARTNEIASLQRAISLYGATISSHNGGLTNINIYAPPLPIIELLFGFDPNWYTSVNPYGYDQAYGLIPTDYDYWHWGPDEVLDNSYLPSGYANGTQYAFTSISNSFADLEGWGLTNGNIRTWVSPNFNATREPSHQILQQLGVKTTGDEKICPFPGRVLSTQTPDEYYPIITIPTSDWFLGNQIAQSVETGQTIASIQSAVDYFYNLGGLINFYAHSSSADNAGASGAVESEYVTYSMNASLHPRLWAANTEGLYNWWLQRSNAQITATSFLTNGIQSQVTINVAGATDTNTAVEIVAPSASFTVGQVLTNGVPAGNNIYWVKGQVIKLLIGNSVTNAVVNYTLLPHVHGGVYTAQEGDPLSVAAPGVLTNATAGAGGGNLMALPVSGPAYGSLTLNTDGSFVYTPSNSFTGIDSFSYQATGGSLTSFVATATIIVTPPNDLFYDNFTRSLNSSNSLLPWIVDAGTWMITNGTMLGTCDAGPGGYGAAYINNINWTDYVAQAQIQFSTINGWAAGLGGRLDPTTGARYAVWVYPDGSGGGADTIKLIKFTSWTDNGVLLGQQSLSSVGINWHTLTLVFYRTNISVYFDKALQISTNDPASALTSGGIIVDTVAGYSPYFVGVSNVVVIALPVMANNDSYGGPENGMLTVNVPGVLINDIGANLTAVEVSPPANGSLTLNANGSFIYTPNTNFTGTDSFTYQASNGQTNSNIATVTLNITPFLANNDSYSLVENNTLNVPAPGVLGNDSTGGASLTAVLMSGPANGVLTLNTDGSFSYTPTNGFLGADTFTYEANNGQTNSNIATVNLTVTRVPPAANNDAYATLENTPLAVPLPGVLANDTTGGGTLSAIPVSGAANGALTLNADGSFNYIPASNYFGIDSFTYKATEGSLTSGVATATIDVTPPGALFYDSFTRSVNNTNSLLPWIVEDGIWTNSNGEVEGQSPIQNNDDYGRIYTGDTNWTDYLVQGQIQFSTANGWGGGIGGRLDPMTGEHYAAWIYPEGSGGAVGGAAALKLIKFNSWLTYTILQTVSLPNVGTNLNTVALEFNGTSISAYVDGALEISYSDLTPFTSGCISVDMATVGTAYTLGVKNVVVTTLPVLANNDSYSMVEDTTLTNAAPGVLANDAGQNITAQRVSGPVNGTLIFNRDGSFSYTPARNFLGTDSFTYEDFNAQATSAVATVTILVTTNIPDPPVANDDSYNMVENTSLTNAAPGVLANDTGGNGSLSALLVSSTASGALTLNANGSFIYTPSNNFAGFDSFTYQATDGQSASGVAMATIMITPQGDLFYDNFSRATNSLNPLFPWVVEDGTWAIANGVLDGQSTSGVNGGYGRIYVANTNWTDYSVLGQMQFSSASGFGGGLGGRLDATTGAHYAAWIYPEGSEGASGGLAVLKLIKFNTWTTYTVLQTVTLPNVGTSLHALALSFQGANIAVSWDGTLEISTTDSSPFASGGISVDMATVGTAYTLGLMNVIVTMSPVLANNDSYSLVENTILTNAAPGVLANDVGQSLTAQLVSGPADGTLIFNGDGSFRYTPNLNFVGTDSFAYEAANAQATSAVATATILVTTNTVNPPTANNDSYGMVENTSLTNAAPGVLANDTGGTGPLSAVLVGSTANGALTLNSDGSFIYTPSNNFAGVDSFTYEATNGTQTSDVATVTILVTIPGSLFSDNFATNTSLFPWILEDGTWTVTNGELQGIGSGPGDYGHVYINTNWTNYLVQAQIQFASSSALGGGVGGRLNPTTGAHYGAWVYPENSVGAAGGVPVLKLIEFPDWDASSYTVMAQVNLPSVGTNWHTVTAIRIVILAYLVRFGLC